MKRMIVRLSMGAAAVAIASAAWGVQSLDHWNAEAPSVLSAIAFPAPLQEPATTDAPAAQEGVEPTPAPEASPATEPAADGYTFGNYFDGAAPASGRAANWVVGLYGLILFRDHEDDLGMSYDPLDPANRYAASTDADMGAMGGVEVALARRNCNGRGIEARYWGLYPDRAEYTLGGAPDSALGCLCNLDLAGTAVEDIYNSADAHYIYRENTFHNVEVNLLGSLCSDPCRCTNWEWIAGYRFFYFDECFGFAAFASDPAVPPEVYYHTLVTNNLHGVQVGGRGERYLNEHWAAQFGAKIGIYGNHIEHLQTITDGDTTFAQYASGGNAGQDYDWSSDKGDFSTLGELNLGLIYQLKSNFRLLGGYRLLGVTGVALGPDQIPDNFDDVNEIQRVNSNGSLILHGLYFGAEYAF